MRIFKGNIIAEPGRGGQYGSPGAAEGRQSTERGRICSWPRREMAAEAAARATEREAPRYRRHLSAAPAPPPPPPPPETSAGHHLHTRRVESVSQSAGRPARPLSPLTDYSGETRLPPVHGCCDADSSSTAAAQ